MRIEQSGSNERLTNRVLKGGLWVFVLRISTRGLYLVKLIILANLLSPGDFGLMGIALLVMAILSTFSQTGFEQALIQKKGDVENYLDTVWTVSIIRGIVLFSVLFFISPYAAIFFKAEESCAVIRMSGLSFLLQSLANVGVVYFQKELEFKKQFIYQLSGRLADFIVAVAFVLRFRSVWALVFGLLAGEFIKTIVSYCIHPYRPHIDIGFAGIKKLFGFGKWIFGSSILVFLLTQGDDIFVGRLLGAVALGFYQMAYRVSNIPATEISQLIAMVTYPAYSKLQDDLSKLREAYLKVLDFTTLLSFPIAGLILVLASDFTRTFLGEKWLPMVPAMQILAVYGLLRAIGATTGVVFMAVGRPGVRTKIQSFQLLLLAAIIYPLSKRWGLAGASLAVTVDVMIFNTIAVYKVLSIVKAEVGKAGKTGLLSFLATSSMICIVILLKTYIFDDPSLGRFLFTAAIGICSYIALIYVTDLFFHYLDKQYIRMQIKHLFQSMKR